MLSDPNLPVYLIWPDQILSHFRYLGSAEPWASTSYPTVLFISMQSGQSHKSEAKEIIPGTLVPAPSPPPLGKLEGGVMIGARRMSPCHYFLQSKADIQLGNEVTDHDFKSKGSWF
ncbi:hypothetical protein ONS95_000868 [Cadophora gregata]|uniref:uncharacterized protein n=1 Tax=Cadophora gregata TaxID=51156 RepID=UPI0026DCB520|nr:uncharacterized protein ONS95_000868 [Cadophora gregata]KAK0128924.1 hypothetical protein ONS95_000868 [Cadophora gregata]